MQEINVRGNHTGLKVFVNGTPNLAEAPKEDMDLFGTVLEIVIVKQQENYVKRKQRDAPKKKP